MRQDRALERPGDGVLALEEHRPLDGLRTLPGERHEELAGFLAERALLAPRHRQCSDHAP